MELKKEEVRSNFQQLHGLLAVRETFLLREMDEVIIRARQEITEKRTDLQQLYTARESLERDLTQNTFKKLLEKNLRSIEDEMRGSNKRLECGLDGIGLEEGTTGTIHD